MNLQMDEKRKHQLIGLIVIIAITILFVPAALKKSKEGLDNKLNVAIKLPQKPAQPIVSEPTDTQMFETIQVAHVDLTESVSSVEPIVLSQVKAESISNPPQQVESKPKTILAQNMAAKPRVNRHHTNKAGHKTTYKAQPSARRKATSNNLNRTVSKPIEKKASPISKSKSKETIANKTTYAVQIASFAVENNAKSLVSKLRKKGYKARYNKTNNNNGSYYKVIVGSLDKQDDAQQLKKTLADSVKLKGFVVKTGVS
jgi:DedD protein